MPRDGEKLPLPIAGLVRKARNARDHKLGHDAALSAWEASLRLTVAYAPPPDPSPLKRPSLGQWAQVGGIADAPYDAPALRRTKRLLRKDEVAGEPLHGRVSPADVVALLAKYRNRQLGHGAPVSSEYYGERRPVLLDGLVEAWDLDAFLPPRARLVYVASVERQWDGRHAGHVLDLSGDAPHALDQCDTDDLPATVLPQAVYVLCRGAYSPLQPWLVFNERSEQVLFFNGMSNGAHFLGFRTGDHVEGADFARQFPATVNALETLFAAQPRPTVASTQADATPLGPLRTGRRSLTDVIEPRRSAIERDWIVEDYSSWRTASNGLQYQLCRLRHRYEDRLDRGKCYDLSGVQRSDHEMLEGMLIRHARICNRIGAHTNVAQNRTSLPDEGGMRWWVVDAWIEGTPLDELLTHGPLTPGDARRVALGMAQGLDVLHRHWVIRRELAPRYIVVRASDGEPVLTEFELAKLAVGEAGPTVSQPDAWTTDLYRAPEVTDGVPLDYRGDVYSWGRVVLHALTGQIPPHGEGGDLLARVDLPGKARAAIRDSLGLSPSARPRDMTAILDAIRGWN